MIPIRDDNPQIRFPVVTIAIIVANWIVWFYLQGAGLHPALQHSICELGLIPANIMDTLQRGSTLICPIASESHWQTLFSSMFSHGGWFHILGNMWFLWIFGNNVEDATGSLRFLIFYILCGLAAALAQVAIDPGSTVPMVGASGAIGGVMGAYIVLYPRVNVHLLIFFGFFVTTFAVPAVTMLGYWILVQFIGGFSAMGGSGGGVAFWAHIGGFIFGAVAILLFKNNQLLQQHPCYGWSKRGRKSQTWRRVDKTNRWF